MAREGDDDGPQIVHVIGRSEGATRRFFYRAWYISAAGSSSFSPWEEIHLSITTEHLKVVCHRGAVFIAWLVTTVVEGQPASSSAAGSNISLSREDEDFALIRHAVQFNPQ